MSSLVVVKRPPRRPAPSLPTGEVILDPPPEVPAAGGRGWTRMLMILPMAAGAAAMGLMMGMQRGGVMTYVVGGMYGVSILGMIAVMVVNQSGPGKREMIESRRQYMRRLAQLRAQVRNTVAPAAGGHPLPTPRPGLAVVDGRPAAGSGSAAGATPTSAWCGSGSARRRSPPR